MIVSPGEKLHIVMRRRFGDDVRRHFAGIAVAVEGAISRLEGYAYVFDVYDGGFVRKPEKRISIFDVSAEGFIAHVLPEDLSLEEAFYELSDKGSIVYTDGKGFSLAINEFGANR